MFKRIRNISRPGWFIVGVVVAVLLIPTAAFAGGKALKFTGIEGSPSGNKAEVTAANQLMTTQAGETNTFNIFELSNATETVVGPTAQPAVVTNIHADVYDLQPSGGLPDLLFDLYNGTCTRGVLISNVDSIIPSAAGMNVLPFTPGLDIPTGDSLCMFASSLSGAVSADGYNIPAGAG
jgi:hypothetical protein